MNWIVKFILDVGPIAWLCLSFGIFTFIFASWSEDKLALIFGLIALLYGWGRVRIVNDKNEILEAISLYAQNTKGKHSPNIR